MQEQEEIVSLAEQVLENSDLFLVDTELKGSVGNRMVSIFVDSESGNISLDRCAEINREIQFLIDASGWRDRKYTLNVSSPGLDRPLKDIRQYVNNLGRNASVVYEEDGRKVQVHGKLVDAKPESVTLEAKGKDALVIPYNAIVETYIQVSFK